MCMSDQFICVSYNIKDLVCDIDIFMEEKLNIYDNNFTTVYEYQHVLQDSVGPEWSPEKLTYIYCKN